MCRPFCSHQYGSEIRELTHQQMEVFSLGEELRYRVQLREGVINL